MCNVMKVTVLFGRKGGIYRINKHTHTRAHTSLQTTRINSKVTLMTVLPWFKDKIKFHAKANTLY